MLFLVYESYVFSFSFFTLQSRVCKIRLYLHSSKDPSTFIFNKEKELQKLGYGLWDNDLIFNFLTKEKQAVNGTIPCRGSYEKDISLYQQLVETLTAPGAVVLDVFASVGKQHYLVIDILFLSKVGFLKKPRFRFRVRFRVYFNLLKYSLTVDFYVVLQEILLLLVRTAAVMLWLLKMTWRSSTTS